jgi:hypothetical protein
MALGDQDPSQLAKDSPWSRNRIMIRSQAGRVVAN